MGAPYDDGAAMLRIFDAKPLTRRLRDQAAARGAARLFQRTSADPGLQDVPAGTGKKQVTSAELSLLNIQ
jgi:hypothetical protein